MKFPMFSGKHIKLRKVTNFCQLHNHLQLLNEFWRKVGSLIILLIVIMSHWPSSEAVVSYFMADTKLGKSFTRRAFISKNNVELFKFWLNIMYYWCTFSSWTCYFHRYYNYLQRSKSFKPKYFPDRFPHTSLKKMCWD